MIDIKVELQNPYDVIVGDGLLNEAGARVKKLLPNASKTLIVTDSNVEKLYLQKVENSFKAAGFETVTYTFLAGEANKNFTTFENIIKAAAKARLTRDDVFVALGGGVVGDLTGFAAATYMRGVAVVQLPTTLLASIDASVGGKTGLDIEEGKNLVGAFHQPSAVIFDTDTLKTLPETEWQNGMGEGVKYAVLDGGRCFEIAGEGINDNNLTEFIGLCVKYKADVVKADEKECGKRKLLNLGHTVGHAEETLSGYTVPHGVAVANGILSIANGSLNAGKLQQNDFESITQLINKYGFTSAKKYGKKDTLNAVLSDKKMRGDGKLDFVNIYGIGDCRVERISVDDFGGYVL